MRILLVEDDECVAQELAEAIATQHYLVDIANDGETAWELAEAIDYDLILLDLMLPGMDGISFCKGRRQKADRTPILLLTAQDAIASKVTALDSGADDYIVKPFNLDELLARMRALLRRGSSSGTPVLEWENLYLDPNNCEVTYSGQLLHLTAKEYALLELFLRNKHRIFSQSSLLDHLWSFDEAPTENAVRAHIKSLRSKLKKAGSLDLIETIYGLGYRLKSTESQNSKFKIQKSPEKMDKGDKEDKEDKEDRRITDRRSPITEKLNNIWERYKDKYSDRINILEQAVTALLKDNLSEELRHTAQHQAHTLIGSLGSFGFAEASHLCRQIEQIFQAEAKLPQIQSQHLQSLIVALRQELEPRQDNGGEAEWERGRGGEWESGRVGEGESGRGVAFALSTQHSPLPTPYSPRLLIVDDDRELADLLILEAKARGIQAEVVTNLSLAREVIANNRPDVVLLDLCFPDSQENGFGLLAELRDYQPPVPVLVFTATENFVDRVKVARLGGQGFLQKPISPRQVIDALAQILQQSITPEAKLLIVDDDPELLDFLRTLLEPWGFKLTLLDDPQQFWDTLEKSVPDLLILDVEMPEFSGIDLCQVVRNDPEFSELPVLFLSAHRDAQTVHRVFAAGADDYVNKPIVGPELVARILNRLERTQILRRLQKINRG